MKEAGLSFEELGRGTAFEAKLCERLAESVMLADLP